jgi:hypothetical protein
MSRRALDRHRILVTRHRGRKNQKNDGREARSKDQAPPRQGKGSMRPSTTGFAGPKNPIIPW